MTERPQPSTDTEPPLAGGSVEFLLRRMQRSKDFPAFSETIRTLNRLASASDKSTEQLAAVIVRDFALTNKILKVVNSAYYAGFAGKVGTISRAIVVLGVESIRALAASLMLFEQLTKSTSTDRVKTLIGKSMFSALLAREAAVDAGIEQPEEAFLAAMFHNLGELLVAFYLPNEDAAIHAAVAGQGLSPTQAQIQVLGLDLEHVGVAVGRHWNFPRVITNSMRGIGPGKPAEPGNQEESVRQVACFAAEATESLSGGGRSPQDGLRGPLDRYARLLTLDEDRVDEVLASTRSEYRKLATGLALSETAPPAIRALVGQRSTMDAPDETDTSLDAMALSDDTADEPARGQAPGPVLLDGLQEATAMLAEQADFNQVVQVVLETLYRAFALRRVALALRDPARRQFVGRIGFGEDVEGFLRVLRFSESYQRDVFHLALKKQTDLHIADLGEGKVVEGLPTWYRSAGPGGALLFLPMAVRQRTVGCILAEHMQPHGIDIGSDNLRVARALRNQLVLGLQVAQARSL